MAITPEQAKLNKQKQNQAQYARLIAEELDCPECGKKTNKQNYRFHVTSMGHNYAVLLRAYRELQEKFNQLQAQYTLPNALEPSSTFDNIPGFLKVRIPGFLKVRIPGEAFWIKMEYESTDYVYGVVNNHLIHNLDEYAWCKYDAKVKWCKVNKVLFEWTNDDNIDLCFKHNDS